MHRIVLTGTLAGALLTASAFAQQPPDFEGRYIAAISDGDMRAYAYIDGDLGPPRGPDQLSIVSLPLAACRYAGSRGD